jgi:hypothetical protein
MNYLNLTPGNNQGGHPFSLDDLETLNNGTADVLNAVSAQHYDDFGVCLVSPPHIAISGGNFTNSSFGVILYGGGGYIRVAANFTPVALSGAPGAAFYVRVTTEFGANDPVTYQSGVPKNVHALTSGILVHTATPGGNDYAFTSFNLCDWVDGTAIFPIQGLDTSISGGFYQFRYRLLSNNTMLFYLKFKGEVTGVVKILLPLPYLFNNSFRHFAWIDNPTNSETFGMITGAADGLDMFLQRAGGPNYTVGAVIDCTGTHQIIETKMRD